MSKIKIEIPAAFSFQTLIPVRITDLNYGGHVGNDSILSIMHEARMQFLKHYGYTEMNFGGTGLIMSDVGIEFKNEVFYGDSITASVCAGDFSKVSFDIYYKFETEKRIIALAKTGMVCFDYSRKKIVSIPGDIRLRA